MKTAIDRISIIGRGALGILYGSFFAGKLGLDHVTFLADGQRVERYRNEPVTCNGTKWRFPVQDGMEEPKEGPAQLLIFAVKATGLDQAVELARKQVGENTAILSVINGISSEEIIGQALGEEHVLYCVAQGMDAVKLGRDLRYTNMGQICLGIPADQPEKEPLLQAVTDLFDRTGLPYTREEDILRRLWCKWMLNVGVNQAVMVSEGTYGTVQKPGKARNLMIAAMDEVIRLAQAEGIRLTVQDREEYVRLVDSLDPEGMPSMRQDGLLHRPTEVELFAGTVILRARKLGVDVPVNQALYEKIKEMERSF